MTPINNQYKAASAQSHDRFSAGRDPRPSNQSRSFEALLGQTNSQQLEELSQSDIDRLEEQSQSDIDRLLEEQRRQQEEVLRQQAEQQRQQEEDRRVLNTLNNLNEYSSRGSDRALGFDSTDLRSGVGAKALHDLQQLTGPLTFQQTKALRDDVVQSIFDNLDDERGSFLTRLEQLDLVDKMVDGFHSMAAEDGKPGLSAEDLRRAATKEGDPNVLTYSEATSSSSFQQTQNNKVNDALNGRRSINLGSSVGAKALQDLQHTTGPLTRQQMQNLHSDLLRGVRQTINTNPTALSSTQLDQLALISLMLKGFDRNAAEDGKPGFSAEDLRQTAARTGNLNILSRQDVV